MRLFFMLLVVCASLSFAADVTGNVDDINDDDGDAFLLSDDETNSFFAELCAMVTDKDVLETVLACVEACVGENLSPVAFVCDDVQQASVRQFFGTLIKWDGYRRLVGILDRIVKNNIENYGGTNYLLCAALPFAHAASCVQQSSQMHMLQNIGFNSLPVLLAHMARCQVVINSFSALDDRCMERGQTTRAHCFYIASAASVLIPAALLFYSGVIAPEVNCGQQN